MKPGARVETTPICPLDPPSTSVTGVTSIFQVLTVRRQWTCSAVDQIESEYVGETSEKLVTRQEVARAAITQSAERRAAMGVEGELRA